MKNKRNFVRACVEIQQIFYLAWPIVLSNISYVLMGLVDTVMAGQAGAREQAIVGIGVAMWIPLAALLISTVQAVGLLVAHHDGANNAGNVYEETRQGMWLGAWLGLLPTIILPWSTEWLLYSGIDPLLAEQGSLYLQGIMFGLPALLIFRALTAYSSSIGRPRPAMVIGFVGVAINVVLNYLLIEGRAGFPAMGGAGCGWATGIGMWVSLVLMLTYVRNIHRKNNTSNHLKWSWIKLHKQIELLKLGVPMGVASLAEVSAFTGVTIMIGNLGVVPLAAHQIALNFAAMVFMLPSGISVAISILVARELGRGERAHARFVALSGLVFATSVAAAIMPLVIAFRVSIVAVYTSDPTVAQLATSLILISVLWHISDAIQVSATGILRGYHVTFTPMIVTFSAFWLVGLPVGSWLSQKGIVGFSVLPLGVAGYWIGLVIGLTMAAVILCRFVYVVTTKSKSNKNHALKIEGAITR